MVKTEEQYKMADARARVVIDRDRARHERRKNALPPFLFVRTGGLKYWLLAVGTAAGFTWSLTQGQENQYDGTNYAPVFWFVGLMFATVFGYAMTKRTKEMNKRDIDLIKREFNLYLNDVEYKKVDQVLAHAKDAGDKTKEQETEQPLNRYTLEFSERVNNQKLLRILVRHLVWYEPGIFDKMIKYPKTVVDLDLRNIIVNAHLDKNSNAAEQVVNTFTEDELDPRTYQRALQFVRRGEDSEKNYAQQQNIQLSTKYR